MTVACPNVTAAILPQLAQQLESHACKVVYGRHPDGVIHGTVESIAGRMTFTLDESASVLHVTLTADSGHFPRMLLIGGIKQMVAEAVEAATRTTAA